MLIQIGIEPEITSEIARGISIQLEGNGESEHIDECVWAIDMGDRYGAKLTEDEYLDLTIEYGGVSYHIEAEMP